VQVVFRDGAVLHAVEGPVRTEFGHHLLLVSKRNDLVDPDDKRLAVQVRGTPTAL
jgi:hypothetical protein